jgi:Ran GTPase-activating protein (RanGAP) involved in mRNA processing and transport
MERIIKKINEVINEGETSINLGGNEIGDEGAEHLSNALSTNTTLTSIILYKNNIGVKGAEYLSNALSTNTTLTSISLYRNNIGDEGVEYLSNVIPYLYICRIYKGNKLYIYK